MSTENTPRSRSLDAELVTGTPRVDAVDVDATIVPVGTFAAGQSPDGRYVAVTAAPQGDFAAGQAEHDPAISPGATEASPEAQSPRSD